jgi:hypothetical protein
VDRQVKPLVGLKRHRCLRLADLIQWGLVVEILFAVPLPGDVPPCDRRVDDGEFRELVGDLQRLQLRLVRERIAKAKAVVENAEDHRHPAVIERLLNDGDIDFVVVIAHVPSLAPRLLPGFVMRRGCRALE